VVVDVEFRVDVVSLIGAAVVSFEVLDPDELVTAPLTLVVF